MIDLAKRTSSKIFKKCKESILILTPRNTKTYIVQIDRLKSRTKGHVMYVYMYILNENCLQLLILPIVL